MKNRIGIFVFYDASGRLDNYIEVLLKSFQKIFLKLIVLVNGKIENLS